MVVRAMMSCFLAFITLLVSGYVAANEGEKYYPCLLSSFNNLMDLIQ